MGAIYVHAQGESNMYPYLHGDDSVLVFSHSFVAVIFSSTKQLRKIITTTGWSALWPKLITGKEMKWQHCPKLFHVMRKETMI